MQGGQLFLRGFRTRPREPSFLAELSNGGDLLSGFSANTLNKLLPIPEALRSQADAYLTALVIFVVPVAALPEFLAKYRLHGVNLFHIGEDK